MLHDPAMATRKRVGDSVDSPAAGGGIWSRKRRWLTTLITPVVVIIMAVGGHRAWTWQAERKLSALVDELRRKGEPVSMAEITPKIAKSDNGAFELRQAADGLPNETETWQRFYNLGPLNLPLNDDELDIVRAVIEQNRDALALVRTAMSKPGVDWAATLSMPTTERATRTPWGGRSLGFMHTRSLGHLLYGAALLSHEDGDETTAVAHIEELLYLARAAGTRPTIRSQFSAFTFYKIAMMALAEMLPDIATRGGKNTAGVKAVVARLLDEQDARDAMLRCLRAERARCIEALTSSSASAGAEPSIFAGASENMPWNEPLPGLWPAGGSFERALSRPIYLNRAQQGIERLNLAIVAFKAADVGEFMQAFPDTAPPRVDAHGDAVDDDGDNGYTRMLTSAIQQSARGHYSILARRRAMAVGLALALYHADHNAWPPVDMAPMFPQYLTKMPLDPLSSGGQPIVYLPDAQRPRVYSVGDDGIDDGGTSPPPNAAPRGEDSRSTDWVVDLVRQPRRVPAGWPGRGG